MANHSFVTTRCWLTADKIEEDLQRILKQRFANKLSYTRNGDYFEIGFDYPYQVPMWVENVHKLEFRNQMPDWCWWVQSVLHNEFALLYNGWISDEGVMPDKWRGVPNKYPTFRSYMKSRYQHHPMAIKLLAQALDLVNKSGMPDKVKATLKGRR